MIGAEFPAVLYLRRSCANADAEVACAPIPASSPRETHGQLDVAVPKGTYFLFVDGENEHAFGHARLAVIVEDTVALDGLCRAAPMLRSGQRVRGDSSGARDRFQASCGEGTESPDVVYRLPIARRSRVVVHLRSEHDGVLHLRRSCSDPASEIVCNDDYEDNKNSRIDTVLEPGLYFVIAEGFRSENVGPFTIDTAITPL